ncbi:hypothetical protein [Cellulomonas fengjieae]|uniref:Ribosomally synthesized peptide with SipW-like signal peptide n=1 Tax=Cellulomonas fengjieae TaxID=2819978 RepID=A0ABS3SDK4_9CELL|nr:hypothetical protein [Cellulomonas fengjieae]MBO3083389.1 hypothetical protein [Cellulomonas fengjieae]MBO3101860.1 hypothetical protein [Cellulomonas fengjieae]QVI65271.1 hypothetical protein KG102_14270 [Cellulomonas fengjieae]
MMDDLLHEMIDPAPVHRDAPRRRRLWTTVAIVGLAVVGATTLTTSAIFTDNDAVSAEIHSGTVDLVIGSTAGFAFAPQNLSPGTSTYAPLRVASAGSLELRYSISFAATQTTNPLPDPTLDPAPAAGDLRDVLDLFVYAVPEAGCNAAGVAALQPLDPSGAEKPWPGTARPLVGSSAQGSQEGDRVLAVGTPEEWLCFRVDFPASAGNEYQDAAVRLDLTFNAEQTANN